eukprot:TRINITY_DN31171_c0_g1_i1.p1 TRINITY_DN31171_c0_g1~~TRINITY_DN31171_c0_g1_i1.p1  ORF type:complete len:551 (+),score=125.38 TRINITY_DN31171_c0_g1_i1:66-1718(+)
MNEPSRPVRHASSAGSTRSSHRKIRRGLHAIRQELLRLSRTNRVSLLDIFRYFVVITEDELVRLLQDTNHGTLPHKCSSDADVSDGELESRPRVRHRPVPPCSPPRGSASVQSCGSSMRAIYQNLGLDCGTLVHSTDLQWPCVVSPPAREPSEATMPLSTENGTDFSSSVCSGRSSPAGASPIPEPATPRPALTQYECLRFGEPETKPVECEVLVGVPPSEPHTNPDILRIVGGIEFGVELEVIVRRTNAEAFSSVKDIVTGRFIPHMNGLPALSGTLQFYEYSKSKEDVEFDSWKVTTDSSIRSEDGSAVCGFEVVSRKCSGLRGIAEVMQVTRAMRRYGCRVNKTTALHVHVSCQHFSDEQLRRIASCVCLFETTIDAFHAYSRRGDHSKYCRSVLKSVDACRDLEQALLRIRNCSSTDELVATVNPALSKAAQSGRNHKVNFHKVLGTTWGSPGRRIEFRQHSGSCNEEEVGMWVRFATLFTHRAAECPTELQPGMATEADLWRLMDDDLLRQFYTQHKHRVEAKSPGFCSVSRELVWRCESEWLLY